MKRIATLVLVFGVLVAFVLLGCAPDPNAEQDRVIAEVEKLGGYTDVHEWSGDKFVEMVFLENNPKMTDAALEHLSEYLKRLPRLRSLKIRSAQITDAGLAHVKGLSQLRTLSLWHASITDAGLEHLKGLPQLRELYLYDTKVTDAGVKNLKHELPDLKIYPQ